MQLALIGVHVTAMIVSLLLFPLAIGLAMKGIRLSLKIATGGFVATGVGFFAGIILLASKPLLSSCAILTAYLLAMIAIYAVGFGWGLAPKARLLKKSIS